MTPEPPLLLLRVAATWPLPGLGLLALPAGPTPHLTAYDLHTTLAVVVELPDGNRQTGTATVEEVSHPSTGDKAVRSLLLELEHLRALPSDTAVWLAGPAPLLV